MSMAELLETLGTMQKSLSSDQDKDKINAAAGAPGAGDGAGAGGGAGNGAGDGDGEGDEEDDDDEGNAGGNTDLAKSFSFTLDDGTVIDAMDATQLLKAMGVQLQATHKVAADAGNAAASAAKAISDAEAGIAEVLKKSLEVMAHQGELIKSLQAEVKSLGAQGRGRRGMASVAEGAEALRKSLQADDKKKGVPPQEFLQKCLSAQKDGRISFMDVATAESAINNGSEVPQHIVNKVLG